MRRPRRSPCVSPAPSARQDEEERAFARLSAALAKFWIAKRCPGFVAECLECLGGGGYIEDGPMPRLYREAPLNGIWEGSGNVIALDIQRTLHKVPAGLEVLRTEVAASRGADARLDAAVSDLDGMLRESAGREERARHVAERLALVLQAALLVRHGSAEVADAFCASRLHAGGRIYGASLGGANIAAILARASPHG